MPRLLLVIHYNSNSSQWTITATIANELQLQLQSMNYNCNYSQWTITATIANELQLQLQPMNYNCNYSQWTEPHQHIVIALWCLFHAEIPTPSFVSWNFSASETHTDYPFDRNYPSNHFRSTLFGSPETTPHFKSLNINLRTCSCLSSRINNFSEHPEHRQFLRTQFSKHNSLNIGALSISPNTILRMSEYRQFLWTQFSKHLVYWHFLQNQFSERPPVCHGVSTISERLV